MRRSFSMSDACTARTSQRCTEILVLTGKEDTVGILNSITSVLHTEHWRENTEKTVNKVQARAHPGRSHSRNPHDCRTHSCFSKRFCRGYRLPQPREWGFLYTRPRPRAQSKALSHMVLSRLGGSGRNVSDSECCMHQGQIDLGIPGSSDLMEDTSSISHAQPAIPW